MKIGFTERGDGGLDLSWTRRLDEVDGVIVVTKNLVHPRTREAILSASERVPIIVHATTTGMGSTAIEPHVPHPTLQLNAIADLVNDGFPVERVVLRVDPIIPTKECVRSAGNVIAGAIARDILPGARLRVSVIDGYPHVSERFRRAGLQPYYEDGRRQPNDNELTRVADMLKRYLPYTGGVAYACAEPRLAELCKDRGVNLVPQGCLSVQDLKLMGIDPSLAPTQVNGQNRHGCLCLTCKTELLRKRKPCPHGCLFCYWKG